MEKRSRLCMLHILAGGNNILINWDTSCEDKLLRRDHFDFLVGFVGVGWG